MIFNGTQNERLILLKALEHEADRQNDFVASLPDGKSKLDERRKAVQIMALFDTLANEGGVKETECECGGIKGHAYACAYNNARCNYVEHSTSERRPVMRQCTRAPHGPERKHVMGAWVLA